MLKIKSFPVTEAEAATQFIAEHHPRGDHGVTLHQGNLVIFYDEGDDYTVGMRKAKLKFTIGNLLEQFEDACVDEKFWEAMAADKKGGKEKQEQTQEQVTLARANKSTLATRIAIVRSMLQELEGYEIAAQD